MLTDIPIIDGLFQSVITYARQTAFIARRPSAFARQTNFTDQQELKQSMKYLFAGIVVCYLIHIPTFIKYDTDMSQGLFLTDPPAALYGEALEKPGVIAMCYDTCRHAKRQISGDHRREGCDDCMPIERDRSKSPCSARHAVA